MKYSNLLTFHPLTHVFLCLLLLAYGCDKVDGPTPCLEDSLDIQYTVDPYSGHVTIKARKASGAVDTATYMYAIDNKEFQSDSLFSDADYSGGDHHLGIMDINGCVKWVTECLTVECNYLTCDSMINGVGSDINYDYCVKRIDGKSWIAENLQNEVDTGVRSFCFRGLQENCNKYGRLYTFSAASTLNICPQSYHVATLEDWETLLTNYDFNQLTEFGTASTGFAIMATGRRNYDFSSPASVWPEYSIPGDEAWFWTTTESTDTSRAFAIRVNFSKAQVGTPDSISIIQLNKRNALSCRCVK